MVQQCIHGRFSAVDQVHDAIGKPRLLDEFDKTRSREGNSIAWLQHHGVASSNCIGQKPQWNHQRKIEWGNHGANTERLSHHDLVDAGRDIFERVALHQHGNAARDLHIFNAASQFCLRLGQRLAVFDRDQAGELIDMLFKHRLELEHVLHAIDRRHTAPRGERGMRRLHRRVYLRGRSGWRIPQRFSGGRVQEFNSGEACGGDPLAADKVVDCGGCDSSHGNSM